MKTNSVKIRLKEIPQEGRRYDFDRTSGELNAALNDLIASRSFEVDMFIKPVGNAYEMSGRVKTSLPETCSKCGWDFDLGVERSFREILMEDSEEHRKNQSVHGNQSVDFLGNELSMTPVRGEVFDPGEFVHEVIALAEPFYPLCGGDHCERLHEVQEIQKKLESEFALAAAEREGHPAFAALQGLDLGGKTAKKT